MASGAARPSSSSLVVEDRAGLICFGLRRGLRQAQAERWWGGGGLRPNGSSGRGQQGDVLHHDRLDRDIAVRAAIAARHRDDGVDHLHAVDHLAEHGIAPALDALAAMVEEGVVRHVDEELRGRRMRVAGARHCQGAAQVFQAVVGLVPDRRAIGFFRHVRRHAAALDHEAGDHAMKHQAVVEPFFHVGEEICRRLRRLAGEHFHRDVALAGFDQHARVGGLAGGGGGGDGLRAGLAGAAAGDAEHERADKQRGGKRGQTGHRKGS